MAAILGWFSEARVRASRRKRAKRCGSPANSAGKLLMATSRPSLLSCARQTSPMPPAPSGDTIRYGPNCRPRRSPEAVRVTVTSRIAGFSRKLPASSCFASSRSTCCRRSVSPPHATSRNAWRASGTRSKAAWKSPSTLRQRFWSMASTVCAVSQCYCIAADAG